MVNFRQLRIEKNLAQQKYSFKWVQVNDSLTLRPSCTHWVNFELYGGGVGWGWVEWSRVRKIEIAENWRRIGGMEFDKQPKIDKQPKEKTHSMIGAILIYY